MLRIFWCFSILTVLNNLALECESYPASSIESTAHIVSYVQQQRKTQKSNLTSQDNTEKRGALQQLFARFLENFDTNLEHLETADAGTGKNYQKPIQENKVYLNHLSDDLVNDEMNTLENSFGNNEQHETFKNETMLLRTKQSIPVLESVRHLVNSVRDGHLNHTVHVQRHQTLLSEMQPMTPAEHNASMAIETEEEREMVNASTDLQFLEVLGSIGTRIWNFLSNIRQVFAASAGSASAALAATSSSNSS